MAPNLAACINQFPDMSFIICHAAHCGNDGGELESWGPAIDELGKLPNVYLKTGAVEEWDVPDPVPYMDRAVTAFPFDRILYESNWFVSEALGDSYDKTAKLLHAACLKRGATEADLKKVFADNARRAYRLDEQPVATTTSIQAPLLFAEPLRKTPQNDQQWRFRKCCGGLGRS